MLELSIEDKQKIEKIDSFEDLSSLAVEILQRTPTPVALVCGPITTGGLGSEAQNARFFSEAISFLRQKGWVVFDQMLFHEAIQRISSAMPPVEYRLEILDVFCEGIFRSGVIKQAFFLPGWQSSRGATWERDRLEVLGIPIQDFPLEWTQAILSRESYST